MGSFNDEQEAAITARDKTILVSAPAGSGKTRILVERMRRLIEEDGYDIENFLVLTFTDAAGKEMKQRLSTQLNEDMADDSISHEVKVHIANQLLKLPQSYMTTFDSFCKTLLSKYGYLVGVMPGFDVLAAPQLMQSSILDRCLEKWIKEDRFKDYVRRNNLENNFDALKQSIINYNATTTSYVNFTQTLHNFYDTYYASKDINDSPIFTMMKQSFLEVFEDCLSAFNTLETYCARIGLESFGEGNEKKISTSESLFNYLTQSIDTLSQPALTYDSFMSLMSTKEEASTNIDWKGAGIEANDERRKIYTNLKKKVLDPIKALKEVLLIKDLNEFYELLELSYQDIEYLLGDNGLLVQFQEAYLYEKQKNNLLDFHDLEEYATKLLSEDLPVLKTLNETFKEIMVDEYQDTNQIQENLVTRIAGQNDDVCGLKVVPMFMVGDMKQSIYRFRQADPSIFKYKFENYTPHNVDKNAKKIRVDLRHNYRSEKTVLDSINYIFDCIMDDQVGGLEYFNDPNALLRYDYVAKGKSIDDLKDHHEFDSEMLIGYSQKDKEYSKAELEAHMVAQKIVNMHEQDSYAFKDFAVLMRNATDFLTYKKIFEEYGIPANITLSDGLFNSNEILSLVALLKALVDPSDDIAMTSVLHNHFVFSDFNENELLSIRNNEEDTHSFYDDVKNSTLPKAQAFVETFEELRGMLYTSSTYEVLIEALHKSHYQEFVASLINGEQRVANIDALIELARSSIADYPYVKDFVAFLDSGASKAPGKIASDDSDAVNFMTIHKSKGLQFKVVFLSATQKQFNNADESGFILMDKGNGIASKYRNYKEDEEFGNVLVEYENPYRNLVGKAIHKEAINEEMRILYVALTRAESKLIMTGIIDDESRLIELARKVQANESDANLESHNTVIYNNAMRKVNNYFDWIMMALMRHPDIEDDLKKYVPGITPNLDLRRSGFKALNNEETLFARFHLTINKLEEIKGAIPERKSISSYDMYHSVEEFYNYIYPYEAKERSIAVTTKQKLEDEKHFDFLDTKTPLNRDDALSLGTLVHNVLSLFEFNDDHVDELIERLNKEGMFKDDEYMMILNYKNHLEDFRVSETYSLIASSDSIYKEKVFRFKEDDMVVNGIFDLVFIKDDIVYVLDYKTDHISSRNSLSLLKEKHRVQIEEYKKVLKAFYHKEVKGYVYYLEINECVEV